MRICKKCNCTFHDDVKVCASCGVPTESIEETPYYQATLPQSNYECPTCQKGYNKDGICSCGLKLISKDTCSYKFFPIAATIITMGAIAVIISIVFICYFAKQADEYQWTNIGYFYSGLTTVSIFVTIIDILLSIFAVLKSRNKYKYNVRQQKLLIQMIKNSKK